MTPPALSGTFAMVDPEHVKIVGPAAAILFARIGWRAGSNGGSWAATRATLAAETGLTPAMVRTALGVLRDRGWLTSSRLSADDPTQVWAPVSAGQPVIADSTPPDGEIRTTPPAESAITSYKTDEELPLVVPISTKASRRATSLPAGYRPKPAHFTLAASLGVDLRQEGPRFVDHHLAKGSTFKDWDAALRTWIRNAAKFAAERATGGETPAPVLTQTDMETWRRKRDAELAALEAQYAENSKPYVWGGQ